MTNIIKFHDISMNIIKRNGQKWLPASQIGEALGYLSHDSVTRLFRRHRDEFGSDTTCLVNLTVQGQKRRLRVFNRRGAHLLGMFAKTERAKEFRKWVLDVLEDAGTLHERSATPGASGNQFTPQAQQALPLPPSAAEFTYGVRDPLGYFDQVMFLGQVTEVRLSGMEALIRELPMFPATKTLLLDYACTTRAAFRSVSSGLAGLRPQRARTPAR